MIPFIIGILLGIYFNLMAPGFIFLIALLLVVIITRLKKEQTTLSKRVYLISLDIFFFLFAIQLINNNTLKDQAEYYGNYYKHDTANYFIVTINDIPVKKEKFIKCQLKVNETRTDSNYIKTRGNIIAYFKRSTRDEELKPGTTIVLKAKLLEVNPPQNPYEFDYKNYLNNKQIYHTAFIDANAFEVLDIPSQLNPIWHNGLLIKQRILTTLKNSALTVNAYAICAALLTGYDDEIDKQVVESFSHSGTLHVLSVSGLHTGLIYLALSFLFDLIDRKKKYKILKFFLITVLLWSFALVTGFSAPVLRAVIMFNLLGIGRIFFRSDHRVQTNILLASAFILLCYDPFFIKDVGFLLSYFAVFGLIYFQPKLRALWEPQTYVGKELWKGTTASFAATISTLPLTLFYFKQFPLWFFICNIIVVPASFIILMLAFLIILKVGFAAVIINYLVSWLITFIKFFNSSKFGFIDGIDFSFSDALFLSFLIVIFTIAIQQKAYRSLAFCIIVFICWQFSALMVSYNSKTKDLLTVYQVNKSNAVLVKNKTNSIINILDSVQFMFHIKPHITSFNNSNLAINEFNYVEKGNIKALILNKKDHWPETDLASINLLVLANNFKITAKDLENFPGLKTVVADASNTNYSIKKVEELCRKFGLELIKTKQQGAYILDL
ncbi:MAG: ComEC/Rec2 family competence protein [Bacteroidetes bacterium]|nr:ComEC/Rec2 family competence protein [Bacteroidota bacterium]